MLEEQRKQENVNTETLNTTPTATTPAQPTPPTRTEAVAAPSSAAKLATAPVLTTSLNTPLPLTGKKLGQAILRPDDKIGLSVEFIEIEKKHREDLTPYKIMDMQVTFAGQWNGKLLKGVVRAIENAYNRVKHDATREAASKRAQVAINQEAKKC